MSRFVKACAAGLATVLLVAPAALAQPTTQDPAAHAPPAAGEHQPAPPQPVRNPTARRCVEIIPTGSRLSRRECHTNAEWQEMQDAARRQRSEWDDRGATPCGRPAVCGSGANTGGG